MKFGGVEGTVRRVGGSWVNVRARYLFCFVRRVNGVVGTHPPDSMISKAGRIKKAVGWATTRLFLGDPRFGVRLGELRGDLSTPLVLW